MTPWRIIRWIAYGLRCLLYIITRLLGSRAMLLPIFFMFCVASSMPNIHGSAEPTANLLAVVFGFWIFCKMAYPTLKPHGPPRFAPRPQRAASLPTVTAASGSGDDPDERTVIGRLDPRLRDLLQPPGSNSR